MTKKKQDQHELNTIVIESERALIGGILLRNDVGIAAVASHRLSGNLFGDRSLGIILDAALELYSIGVSPDAATVFGKVKDLPKPEGNIGWGVYLNALAEGAIPLVDSNAEFHCRKIIEAAMARKAGNVFQRAAEVARSGNVAEAMEIYNTELLSATGDNVVSLKNLWEDHERIANYRIRIFRLDEFRALNIPDYSIVRPGLLTIGAEANTGKSSFATALLMDILQNNENTAGIVFSLDDSVLITGKRILSQLLRRNLFQCDAGAIDVGNYQSVLERLYLRDYFAIGAVEAEARNALKVSGCKKIVLVIDYLQIIASPVNYGGDRREFLNEVVKELKEIQKRLESAGFDCLIVLLSQLNRTDNGQTFRYRETSEIENQADVCLDIYAEMRDTTEEEKQKMGVNRKQVADLTSPIRNIRLSKNKLGKKGVVFGTEIDYSFNFRALELRTAQNNFNSKDYRPLASF